MDWIAKFEKVSKEQYMKHRAEWGDSVRELTEEYELIKKPLRATKGSAGYDFFLPYDIRLLAGEEIVIPTGIRALIENGWFLGVFPKSGLGFKYRVQLANTVGIIDSDYSGSDNEGHILIKIVNCGDKTLQLAAGKSFAQGIFLQHGITVDDDAVGIRNGGIGSTN